MPESNPEPDAAAAVKAELVAVSVQTACVVPESAQSTVIAAPLEQSQLRSVTRRGQGTVESRTFDFH